MFWLGAVLGVAIGFGVGWYLGRNYETIEKTKF